MLASKRIGSNGIAVSSKRPVRVRVVKTPSGGRG
jgi:hypothetical protein